MLYCHKYFSRHFLSIFYKKKQSNSPATTMGGIKQEQGDGSQQPKASHSADQRQDEVCSAAPSNGCRDRVPEISQYLKQLIDLLTIF